MSIHITHPRPEVGRQKFLGVEFHNGVAEVDELHPERRLALIRHGATITENIVEGTKLESLTRKQLEADAIALGIDVSGVKNKPELIALIEASDKVPSVGMTVYAEPRFEVKIDGERHHLVKGSTVTAAELLALEDLTEDTHEIHLVKGPGESERVESVVIDGEMDFVTVAISTD